VERRVTRARVGMFEGGHVKVALELAKEGAELLASKYQDPTSAAYGGLMLYRYGRLRDQADWVENLARDFEWLPDGRVLLSAMLAQSVNLRDQERGLETLLDVTKQPLMVFSEAFSLALKLLRRWPGNPWEAKRDERLETLAPFAARYDYESQLSTLRWRVG
jgi:hypothetical protein